LTEAAGAPGGGEEEDVVDEAAMGEGATVAVGMAGELMTVGCVRDMRGVECAV